MIFDKMFLFIIIIFNSFVAIVPSCHATSNLSLGKPYTISSPPNYPLAAPQNDTTSLTDGKYTTGYFWTQKSTVGWQGIKYVEIMIDLEKVSTIGSVSFNSASGIDGNVHFPSNIAVFVGPDKNSLQYVGDAAKDSGNLNSRYQIKRLVLSNIDTKGRFVLLKVELKGHYLFCDEIEVLEGTKDKGIRGNLSLDSARTMSQQMVRLDIEKSILSSLAAKLKQTIQLQPALLERLGQIQLKITSLSSLQETESVESGILSIRQEVLSKQFPSKQLLVESVNSWKQVSPVTSLSGVTPPNLALTMPQSGYDHASLLLTNLMSGPQQVALSVDKMPIGAPGLLLHEAQFIKHAALEYVPDPLQPLKTPIILKPGESKMFFLTAKANRPGEWKSALKVSSGASVTAIPILSIVTKNRLPEKIALNTVNWGYLDFKLIKGKEGIAVKDLLAHHTNVIVVPPGYLPLADSSDSADYQKLVSYLAMHRGASKVVLFMMYRDASRSTFGNKYQFLDEKWKEGFRRWYAGVLKAAAKAGFTEEQVYLYPFDEMSGNDIDKFIVLSSWAKKTIAGTKFFATLDSKDALKALPNLDIAQIHNKDTLLKSITSTNAELWLYDTKKPAKALSPYSYYRLMAWQAFVGGYKGIGFWAYADAGWGDNPGTAWDDFDGKNPDYAVIYEGEGNTIISSRRWEAWRMGIEDYELLTMYAKVKGDAAAKALAKDVLDHPEDTTKADAVRRSILQQL